MKCFVIMPFGSLKVDAELFRKFQLVYSQWIKPTVEAIRLPGRQTGKMVCHRADKDVRPGEIIAHIIENLVTSDIVIADLTGKNPNVFYELGVRHTVSNKTILITEDLDDIPFDLRGLRTIPYRYDPEHMLKFRGALSDAIREIIGEPQKIDNPVRRFLYEREVDTLLRHAAPPGYDVVRNTLLEMSLLRNEVENHTKEVRRIMELITSSEREPSKHKGTQEVSLTFLEGVWRNPELESSYYARVVDGELFVPYCYGGNFELTSHFYNCRVIGRTLFARFEWFKKPYSGYVFFDVKSKHKLVGGWWFAEQLTPYGIGDDIARIRPSTPGMRKIALFRDAAAKQFPDWAERYFDELSKR